MPYQGNVPSNVNKDAKYSVVHGAAGGMEVRLIYRLGRGEEALITTRAHPELVEMVNAAKVGRRGSPGGAFYINEYGHVLVPVGRECHYAGTYSRYLEFDFEGERIGPVPPSGLNPGVVWRGPRVGIRHVLRADGIDIFYRAEIRPNVFREKRLSQECGRPAAARLAQRLSRVKPGGGRIYINEARAFFAPKQVDGEWVHVYLGDLGSDEWFAPPSVT